jgi:hypothetical protein
LLTVRPGGFAFLVVHAVARFSDTQARAGDMMLPAVGCIERSPAQISRN